MRIDLTEVRERSKDIHGCDAPSLCDIVDRLQDRNEKLERVLKTGRILIAAHYDFSASAQACIDFQDAVAAVEDGKL